MTDLNFTGNAPQSFLGGIKGTAPVFGTLVDQHRFTYAAYRPPAIVSYLGPSDGLGGMVTSSIYVDVARFYYPGNADNREISFSFIAMAAGGTGRILVTVDGTDQGVVEVTSAATYTINITPTTATDPSEILVEGKTTAGILYVISVGAQARQADAALGTSAAGWSYADKSTFTATGAGHASERWHRLINGPRAIAADRRACVVNVCDILGGSSSRSPYASDSTDITTVCRFRFAGVDAGTRDYLVAVYFEVDAATTFAASVTIGSNSLTATTAGWTTATFTLPSAVEEGSAKLQITSGAGYAYLRTLQVIRKV